MNDGGKDLIWNNYFEEIDKTRQYRGQWSKDRSEWKGLGEIKYTDGSVYQGMIKNKLFNGKGRITHANGDIYQGEWTDGKANGKGTFIDMDGSMYDGQWLDDKQHGKGMEVWNNGQIRYSGQFEDGKKTGMGRFDFEGSYYEGEFEDGKFEGKGKYYFADSGKVYEGEFRDNSMNGVGVMVWPDQARYEGEFQNGKMHGRGIKQLGNGNRYVGQFNNDQYDGSAIWYDAAAQTKRQGEWSNGKRVAWLSQAQPTHVSGFGDQNGTQPFQPRDAQREHRGGKWRDGQDSVVGQSMMAGRRNMRSNVQGMSMMSHVYSQ